MGVANNIHQRSGTALCLDVQRAAQLSGPFSGAMSRAVGPAVSTY